MEKVRWEPAVLARLVEDLFRFEGVAGADAATIARVQLEADLRGRHSHGTRAVPMYLNRIHQGIINPRPNIRVSDYGAVAVIVHAFSGGASRES